MQQRELLIVESPTKARTIQRFVGERFVVESSYGHVRDLPEKDDNAVDVHHGYTPRYVILPDKQPIVKRLRQLAESSPRVWLATDEDREGEAISWHLAEVLRLPQEKIRRIVFHEITRSAIEHALQNPRGIDMNLVNAQQARRILDRLVGYELSPLLWKKLRGAQSAGRVQSVAVRLIVEREREIEAFTPTSQFRIRARFRTGSGELVRAEMPERLADAAAARELLQRMQGETFTVASLETKPAKKSPPPPFTTSTLQQEASRRLGLPIAVTMRLAQQLYESGYITYMRTDSVTLSEEALDAAAETVAELFGAEYHQRRQYQTKVANAQEAHEAIRPTDFSRRTLPDQPEQAQKLYELIWKRALASQMKDAQLERTIVTIVPNSGSERFVAEGEVVLFDGFLRLYTEQSDDEADAAEEQLLPPLELGQLLQLEQMIARQVFTRPPARYTEATLVRKLEELGIGRPSTYATIVARIQERGYVERKSKEGTPRQVHVITLENGTITEGTETEIVGAERNKLFPTPIGILVTDFLLQHFPDVMDYQFTATVEEQFDQIARGELDWRQMLDSFYKPFHAQVEEVLDTAPRAGRRRLGVDPETGEDIFVGVNPRQQLYVQRGDKFATVPSSVSIDSITLEQARYYLQFPRVLGEHDGGIVSVAFASHGAYVEWRNTRKPLERRFATIPDGYEPLEVTLDQAIAWLEEKAAQQQKRQPRVLGTTDDGREVAVGVGRFGPYVRIGDEYVSISADQLQTLTLEQALELLAEKQARDEQSVLRRFSENPDAVIRQGKHKPYLQVGSKIYWLPEDLDVMNASLEECLKRATPAPRRSASKQRKQSVRRRS